jgi:poly-gamma-glutamate system protein
MSKDRLVLVLALVSLVFFIFVTWIIPESRTTADSEMAMAALTMERCVEAIGLCAKKAIVLIDPRADPNRTGLIGLVTSEITTSLGQVEAKRTTINPNFAGLVAKLLKNAGVGRGDAVAIGASSSFPALILASLSAVRTLGAKPVMISSLGASNWGANNPDFTWLEMLECLRRAGVLDVKPIALALGGEKDDGSDMSEPGRLLLREKIKASGILFLEEPGLSENVRIRMGLYEEHAAPGKIKAFVNIGGSWANMGTDSSVLKLEPGRAEVKEIPPPEKRGVIQEMAARGIPVIHLLFVKGLAERYGLPWDPVPLPKPGEGSIFAKAGKAKTGFLFAAGAYLATCAGLFVSLGLRNRRSLFFKNY